jgi:hypothetical protein
MAKLTAAKIKEQIKKIQQALKKEKSRSRKQNLIVIEAKPEDIARKLRRMKSPFLVSHDFTGYAPAGGTINYKVGIWNPDPTAASFANAHVWVGSGIVDPVIGRFLMNVDTRFPRLTEPEPLGATIQPSSSLFLSFALKVPAGLLVQKTSYFLNVCLMQFGFFDVGVFLDRGSVSFRVT